MTQTLKTLSAFAAVLALMAACTAPNTYPVSGEECGPSDPVKELDASDCAIPGAV